MSPSSEQSRRLCVACVFIYVGDSSSRILFAFYTKHAHHHLKETCNLTISSKKIMGSTIKFVVYVDGGFHWPQVSDWLKAVFIIHRTKSPNIMLFPSYESNSQIIYEINHIRPAGDK